MKWLISIFQNYFAQQQTELIEQKQLNEAHLANAQQANTLHVEKFMAMLPIDKRGELLCLEMAEHYVKVHTSMGHHLLLMRFKDALELLEQHGGLQLMPLKHNRKLGVRLPYC